MQATSTASVEAPLDAGWLRQIVLDAGADDVGFVGIDRPEVAGERARVLDAFPRARAMISYVRRMNREAIRTPARSVANLEFHHTGDEINAIARRVAHTLQEHGVGAIGPAMGFPMEMDRLGDDLGLWVVSHKVVAEAAGLGRMGIHRNVIHPRYGNFILLGTVIIDAEVSEESRPIDYDPCLECKLCVAACPVGAIGANGEFDFSACYTHNYREFMGGFGDWVESIASSKSAADYRRRVSDSETWSMWQSLSFGANYKAAYCMAVCPAGEDVIAPFQLDRRRYKQEVVKPLQLKQETVYVVPGSDAQEHVARRFPHKTPKPVGNGLRAQSIKGLLRAMPLVFQPGKSKGLDARFHFTFTGREPVEATVAIRDQKVRVREGHHGDADVHVTADGETWLGYLAGERSLVWALLRRRVRVIGPLSLMKAFGRCFPS